MWNWCTKNSLFFVKSQMSYFSKIRFSKNEFKQNQMMSNIPFWFYKLTAINKQTGYVKWKSKQSGYVKWKRKYLNHIQVTVTTWTVSKYGVMSGPYFPYLDWIRKFTDTFHPVRFNKNYQNIIFLLPEDV